jgi:hypothetical protein
LINHERSTQLNTSVHEYASTHIQAVPQQQLASSLMVQFVSQSTVDHTVSLAQLLTKLAGQRFAGFVCCVPHTQGTGCAFAACGSYTA